MPDAATRQRRGLAVVILLGVIFFTLLALLLLKTGRPATEEVHGEEIALTVLPMRIRIRTEPSAKAPVVATATSGETVKQVEERGAWVRVETGDGLSGWAERANLERKSERDRRLARYAAIRKLPSLSGNVLETTGVYAGPGIFYPLIGELRREDQVTVFTRDHDFYAVEYKGQVGYADIDAVDVTASGSRQFDVASAETPQTTETASAPPPTDTSEEVPAPPSEFVPPVEPVPQPAVADQGGVYAAVPPGGTQPEEIDRVIPRYPAQARRSGAHGAVVIRGIVRRDGSIDDVEILKDAGYGLGDAARDAVRRWRFRPATLNGEPIDVYYTVTVNFRLR